MDLANVPNNITSHQQKLDVHALLAACYSARQTKFLRTWAWAMPERAQQLGLMVYRVVDDVTWVQVARDLPEMIPRGLPGYRRYY